jgi:hypothetical protein
MSETLKLEVLKGHALGGARGDVVPGDVLSCPGELRSEEIPAKIALGYVTLIEGVAEADEGSADVARAPEGASGSKIENGDPTVVDRDPKPKLKKRKQNAKPKKRK